MKILSDPRCEGHPVRLVRKRQIPMAPVVQRKPCRVRRILGLNAAASDIDTVHARSSVGWVVPRSGIVLKHHFREVRPFNLIHREFGVHLGAPAEAMQVYVTGVGRRDFPKPSEANECQGSLLLQISENIGRCQPNARTLCTVARDRLEQQENLFVGVVSGGQDSGLPNQRGDVA